MRFSELEEKAPPGMEKWIKDRKPEFKKRYGDRWQEVLYATAWKQHNESVGDLSEMDKSSPQPGRDGRVSHSKYGSRDNYKLGEPETTLGPNSIAKPKDVAKQGMSALSKAMKQAHSKGVAEGSDDLRDSILEVLKTIYNGASAGNDMIDYLADEFNQYYDEVEASGDQSLQNAYSYMMDNGQEAEGDPQTMTQIAKQAISMLMQGVAEGRFDEPLTGWHIVYRKSGNPVHATPSFETKDQAQKYLMTKMFANHQDYKVVHTAGVGVAEGTSNIGQKVKALYQKVYDQGDDSIDYMYHESPVFAQYWDEYEGEWDEIIANVDPSELQIIHDELEAYLQGPGMVEAYTVTRGIDKERYQARPGLEGPFSTKSGKVVYYDKVEGKYYDPDTDMYIDYDDWRAMNEGGSALSQAVREAGWGRRSSYYNPMDQERREQDQMDYDRRAFKRAELQHELGHEDDPNFERNLRQQQIDRDRGPWYIRIDGIIYRQKGQPKSFDWKRGANNYALAILKNNPSLQGKIMLTKSAEDKAKESVTESAKQLEERRKAKKKHKVTVRNPDTGRSIKVDFGEPEDITKHKKHKR